MVSARKIRLDELLVRLGLASDRHQAGAFIGAGKVLVNDSPADKAGTAYDERCIVRLKAEKKYVGRGGEKLAAALDGFGLAPTGMICADIGCSTGGFTDCLLQNGARLVYCVDVGYGVLDWKLRQDKRVVVLERTNARYLSREQIPLSLDLAVLDASFISLAKLLRPLLLLFGESIRILALVKPQFELPRHKVGQGGVVHDSFLHEEAVAKVLAHAEEIGLQSLGVVASPITGAKGNREFLVLLQGSSVEVIGKLPAEITDN
ncbi:MAG: TlyA family RNA methyltransferase [Desulfobulbaceae bacterium]|nr:TlyA family RNA methyltransferase [Desulfobulbaceae bacterium]